MEDWHTEATKETMLAMMMMQVLPQRVWLKMNMLTQQQIHMAHINRQCPSCITTCTAHTVTMHHRLSRIVTKKNMRTHRQKELGRLCSWSVCTSSVMGLWSNWAVLKWPCSPVSIPQLWWQFVVGLKQVSSALQLSGNHVNMHEQAFCQGLGVHPFQHWVVSSGRPHTRF